MPISPTTAKQLAKQRLYLHEQQRLKGLSIEALVAEVAVDDVSDDLRVVELMDRLLPDWRNNAEVERIWLNSDEL